MMQPCYSYLQFNASLTCSNTKWWLQSKWKHNNHVHYVLRFLSLEMNSPQSTLFPILSSVFRSSSHSTVYIQQAACDLLLQLIAKDSHGHELIGSFLKSLTDSHLLDLLLWMIQHNQLAKREEKTWLPKSTVTKQQIEHLFGKLNLVCVPV